MLEATALPTGPQPLPYSRSHSLFILSLSLLDKAHFKPFSVRTLGPLVAAAVVDIVVLSVC